jgi:hypothetical protein
VNYPENPPVVSSAVSQEQFRELMIAALEDSPRAREIVRQAFLPAFPIQGAFTQTQNYIAKFADSNGNTENSAIYQSGTHIGIGTTSPSFTLDVNSNVFAIGPKQDQEGAGGTMRFRDDTSTVRWSFGIPGTSRATDFFIYNNVNGHAPLVIQAGANSYGLYLHGNGNTGILTDSPSFPLDVNGNVLAVGTKTASAGKGGAVQFRDDTATSRWAVGLPSTNGATNFRITDLANSHDVLTIEGGTPASAMVLKSSGNVGIGTASPAVKLDVAGGINATGNVGLGVTSPPEKLTAAVGSNFAIYMSTPGSPAYSLGTGGSLSGDYYYQIVALDGEGKVTMPGGELHVNVPGGSDAVTLNWSVVPGASSYRVYRGSSSGGENVYYTVYTNSYKDTGASPSGSGAPLNSTTAYFAKLNAASGGLLTGGVVLGGSAPKQVGGGPEQLSFQHGDVDHVAFAGFKPTDTYFRFGASIRGFMEWGPGEDNDQDVALYRFGDGGGLVVQSFNGRNADDAFAVRQPTSGSGDEGPDLFRVATNGGISSSKGLVAVNGHVDPSTSAWTGTEAIQTTSAKKTTDASTTTLASLTLEDNRAYYITARVVAREGTDTSSSNRAFYWRAVLAYRQGANAVIQANTVVPLATVESDSNWDCTIDTDGVNDVRVRVKGGSTAVYWVAEIGYQSVRTDS